MPETAGPTTAGGASTTQAGSAYTGGSSLPWHLIPAFKPGETDINDFSRRVTFLAGIWPQDQMTLLAPRIAMSCEGSAFQKMVRLDPSKLKVSDTTGVALIVKTLGGVFGKTTLENRFERFERAIYTTVQRPDESHESFVARPEVQFEDLLSQGVSLEDVRAYVLLRNSGLTAEEKKKVIVDADGNLTYGKVIDALRLLGSKFFHEVQNGSKPAARQKTYDVNFIQDDVDGDLNVENEEHGFAAHADLEEALIEQLHHEGDEDALIVSQFEDQILEVLQEDPSMASCFNTYVEARRKLSEKARYRGFWQPSGGKGGKGKSKNKSKGKNSFSKRSLEHRIANSQCKRCFQWGHWKAECPQRHQSSSNGASATGAAFTGVALHEDELQGPWNFVDDDLPPDHAVAFVAQDSQDQRGVRGSCMGFKTDIKTTDDFIKPSSKNRVGLFRNTLAKCLGKLSHRMQPSMPNRAYPSSIDKPRSEPLSPSFDNRSESSPPVNEESAQFVSQGAEGIVDLGASLSVIGEGQFQELCQHLPPSFQNSMKMAPCDISFRFGNDSTVRGTKAVYIPLGQWWMKLIVVPSNTPFLIANSLFRNLGAIIDTNKHEVYFQKLDCTVPISLSERRLFMLDLSELIRRTSLMKPEVQKKVSHQFVCQCVSENSCKSKEEKSLDINPSSLHQVEPSPTATELKVSSCSDSGSKDHPSLHRVCDSIVHGDHGSTIQDQFSGSGRKVSKGDQIAGRSNDSGRDSSYEIRRPQGLGHGLRASQTGIAVPRSDQGQQVCELVCESISRQPTDNSCPSSAVCEAACGTPGELHDNPSQEQGVAHQAGGKSLFERHRARGAGDRQLGASPPPGARDECSPRSHESSGECDATDPESFDARPIKQPITMMLTSNPEMEPDWLGQCLQALNETDQSVVDLSFFLEAFHAGAHADNWVAREMWDYFKTKGDVSKHFSTIKHDLMEIYCSTDSELTKQGIQQGLLASRFGLRDGDLSTREGRKKLYDRLWNFRPGHVWMSPKCRAWCRWSIFNMHRSISSAQKVLTSREDDLVHLLLCSAIMQLQHFRNRCHFHLEQPVGSHMMFQEEMDIIVTNTHRVTCDMCVAGQLKHPDTKKPIRKSTQVFTSSTILQRTLESLKCPRNHEHSPVEGSCTLPNGKRCAVSRFTELYTRTFATKVCKALKCSLQVQEAVVALPEVICPAVAAGDGKRRRLEEKQEPPHAYVENDRQKNLQAFIQAMLSKAPKVGKAVFTDGPLLQQCEELFPGYQIAAIEACKGADRYRLPPVGITKQSAPLRWSMGCHRNESGTFSDNDWEDWSKITRKHAIRNCPPARLLISVFAKARIQTEPSVETHPTKRKSLDGNDEPLGKKHCPSETRVNCDEPLPKTANETDSQHKCQTHGPLFSSLPHEIKSQILKIHKNLGHPDNRLLARVLKEQQWDSKIVDSITDMVCPSCFENQKPRLARPAHISQEREFNDLLMIDGIEWTNQEGIKHLFYHMIDAATNFHIAIPADCRSSSHVIELLKTHWITWAGAPRTLMSDSAGEFCSEEFGTFLQSLDIQSVIIPAEAHWQLGRCERHGAILQNMLDKYQKDQPIRTTNDLREALLQCVQAKNSMSRVHGYTPEILVLGRSRHFPSCNSNEQTGSSDWLSLGEEEESQLESSKFLENLARRETARKAFVSADHDQKLRRALLRQSRPKRETFEKGQWVMFWRHGKVGQPSQWLGPGKVIVSEEPNVIWITHLSRLYRCAPEHLRAVSERECQAARNSSNAAELPDHLGTGVFQYTDLTGNQAINVPVDHHTLNPPDVQIPPDVVTSVPSGSSEMSEEQPDAEPSGKSSTGRCSNPWWSIFRW